MEREVAILMALPEPVPAVMAGIREAWLYSTMCEHGHHDMISQGKHSPQEAFKHTMGLETLNFHPLRQGFPGGSLCSWGKPP